MKFQLGIFQEKDQIDQYLEAKGIKHQEILVAGPFSSRVQAVAWMDYIEKKTGQGKMERHAVGLMNQKPWYGITFEQQGKTLAAQRWPVGQTLLATAAGMR